MAKIKLSTVLRALALLAVGAMPALAANGASEKAQILIIEQNMAASTTAAGVIKHLSPDVVFDDLTPGQVRGIGKVGADLTKQFEAVKDLKVTILKMSISADDYLAFAYSMQQFSMIVRATNQPVQMTFRQVDCYHKIDGKWLMAYQNLSVPFDSKTGKAVFNAQP